MISKIARDAAHDLCVSGIEPTEAEMACRIQAAIEKALTEQAATIAQLHEKLEARESNLLIALRNLRVERELSAATIERLEKALRTVDKFFSRSLADGNFLGDDSHETWKDVADTLAGKETP